MTLPFLNTEWQAGWILPPGVVCALVGHKISD